MSLLRLCSFPKCLTGRIILERNILRVRHADRCHVCQTGVGRIQIADKPWTLTLRRRFSARAGALVPKADDGNVTTRVQKQFQLLDVLEARIQQLQSDVLLNVQHAKVQMVKAPPQPPSKKTLRVASGEKAEQVVQRSRAGQAGAQSSGGGREGGHAGKGQAGGKDGGRDPPGKASRWLRKLSEERKNKTTKQQHLRQKLQETGILAPPGASGETASVAKKTASAAKKTAPAAAERGKAAKTRQEQSARLPAVAGAETGAEARIRTGAGAGAGAWPSGGPRKGKRATRQPGPGVAQGEGRSRGPEAGSAAQDRAREQAEVEELQRRLKEQLSQWTSTTAAAIESRSGGGGERLLEDREGNVCGDTQLATRSYLEACVFAGDVERAGRFLLSHHRRLSRRRLLSVGAYNVLMRVWAKRGSLNQLGRVFILLEEAGLKPNLTSYCAALECMGRTLACPAHTINRCLSQMQEDGLSVDDLFSRCVFRQDERDMVLRAVNTVRPDYQPSASPTPLCSSPLVTAFYSQRAEASYPRLAVSQADLQEHFGQQLALEQACTVTIHSVEASKPVTEHMAKMRALLAEQRSLWQETLLQALRENKQILASSQEGFKRSPYPYLCLLQDREYVDIMMQSLTGLSPIGESLHVMAKELGSRVHTKLCVLQKNRSLMVHKLEDIYKQYAQLLVQDPQTSCVLPREEWCRLEAEHSSGASLQSDDTPWPHMVMVDLGTHLLELMITSLTVPSDLLSRTSDRKLIPILYHMYTFRSNKQVGFIKPHPILIQLQTAAMETTLTFDSYVMPMLCPPVPWTSSRFGAYLVSPAKLMRTVDGAVQHELLLDKTPEQELHAVLDSLTQLGNVAWSINRPLLDTIISVFNDRGNEDLDIPPPGSEAPKIPRFNPHDPSYTQMEKAHLKREIIKAKKKTSEMHSLRMTALYKLSIANHMRDEVFWFPHSMDFRGRTYPCPPHFNHLGSDVSRAILVFAEGKPLGPRGLDWLKIHLVNLTGLKKRSSLAGRLDYANSIMEDILDSADNPLDGKKWWMDSEEAWQTLACCKEIANVHRSPDPTQFISHFPVHQDGSCNGLQHYAALGRDVIGATSVNLTPCLEPQDVYTGVAQQVEEFRVRDAVQGLKVAQVLEGYISRKVVKQTVMTVVYGVTRYGGRLQIEKRLKEIDGFPKEYVWDASRYLVHQVFSSLKEMFTGTREIQDWLTESARLIAKSGSTVEWVTPLGLPIIQPYHRTRSVMLKSSMQHVSFQISYDAKERPDTVKQKNAFPPNFIHSLDSTHMMLTALYCYSAGLTFVSVHDCFWTHAQTVDTMNKVCREQFVALHSQPILQELSNFLLQKYCSGLPPDAKLKRFQEYKRMLLLLSKVPKTGDFDLQRVKESCYFFC